MTSLQLVSIVGIGDQGSGIKSNAVLDRELPIRDPGSPIPDPDSITLRTADVSEAAAVHELIVEHLAEGHLLPRERGEIVVHAHRFVVAVQEHDVLACAELAPLSRSVADRKSTRLNSSHR